MRVLIGYDGSDCSETALAALARAGFPSTGEILVLSVADVWPGSLDTGIETLNERELARLEGIDEKDAAKLPAVLRRAYSQAHEELLKANKLAAQAADRLRGILPGWAVTHESVADPPAWGIIRRAEAWRADLVVVGSHGRSALGRFFLGSVSHFVASNSKCNVRISSCGAPIGDGPIKLVIGVDGSADAQAAVREAASRRWPPGSEARVVAALDPRLLTMPLMAEYPAWGYADPLDADERAFYKKMVASAASELQAAGLTATPFVREGDPKWVLAEEAERWGADCIFLGARGHSALDRVLMGSVSLAVAVRAHCTVEIVRP